MRGKTYLTLIWQVGDKKTKVTQKNQNQDLILK